MYARRLGGRPQTTARVLVLPRPAIRTAEPASEVLCSTTAEQCIPVMPSMATLRLRLVAAITRGESNPYASNRAATRSALALARAPVEMTPRTTIATP